MTTQIRAVAEMKFKPGIDVAAALACVRRVSARTEAQDHATLAHNYYVDRSRGLVIAHEHYADSVAMIAHLANMDPADLTVLMASFDIASMRFFGQPSDELRTMLAGFGGVEYFEFVSGFTR